MGRSILAVLVGLAAGVAAIYAMMKLGHAIYPPPEMEPGDTEAIKLYIDSAPFGALFFVVLGHFVGTAIGCCTACMIQKEQQVPVIVVGFLLLASTAANLAMIPHPLWFTVADPIGVLLAIVIILKLKKMRVCS